jgi:hypothetical protein
MLASLGFAWLRLGLLDLWLLRSFPSNLLVLFGILLCWGCLEIASDSHVVKLLKVSVLSSFFPLELLLLGMLVCGCLDLQSDLFGTQKESIGYIPKKKFNKQRLLALISFAVFFMRLGGRGKLMLALLRGMLFWFARPLACY